MIRYLDKVIRPLALVLPKISEYVKTFKVRDGDKNKSNKLMSFRIDDEKLLEKFKTIWTKIGHLWNIELNTLPVHDEQYTKTKVRTYGEKFYTNFHSLNVPEDDIKCKSFTVISVNSLLVYQNKYYLQIYLDNCTCIIAIKQMTDYLDDNFFEID